MRKLMFCLACLLFSFAVAQPAPVNAGILPPTCTYSFCIRNCNDCPYGTINYCISTVTCECGCR